MLRFSTLLCDTMKNRTLSQLLFINKLSEISCDVSPLIYYDSHLNPNRLQYVPVRYAGHAKWQNIQHIKAANDARKSSDRTKFVGQMKIAIREGGNCDPKLNKQLADVIQAGKERQIPNEVIQKVLLNAKEGKEPKTVAFAFKGPSKSVLLVEFETDSSTKTRQEISALVKKRPFVVTDVASVNYQFKYTGIILCAEYNGQPISQNHVEEAVNHAIEAGAEDVTWKESTTFGVVLEFVTDSSPATFNSTIKELQRLNYKVVYSDLEYIPLPHAVVELSDSDVEIINEMYGKLNSRSDLIRIFSNVAEH